jgi:hypothetical protein
MLVKKGNAVFQFIAEDSRDRYSLAGNVTEMQWKAMSVREKVTCGKLEDGEKQ